MACEDIGIGVCTAEYISIIPPMLVLLLILPNACFTLYRLSKEREKREKDVSQNQNNIANLTVNFVWGHTSRWLCYIILSIIYIFDLCSSILSLFQHHPTSAALNPAVLIINDISYFLALVIIAFVYSHLVEGKKQHKYLWFLWVYWILVTVCDATRHFSISNNGGSKSARLLLTKLSIVIYALLIILEAVVLFKKKYGETECNKDVQDIKYRYSFVIFPSQLTVHWINDLLRKGYKSPLQLDELGILPMNEHSKFYYNKFHQVFEEEKLRNTRKSRAPSLWKCYVKVFWPGMMAALACHLISVTTVYTGPIFLELIVAYVVAIRDNIEQNSNMSRIGLPQRLTENNTKDSYFLSSKELFNNGYCLCLAIFIGALVQGISNQHFIFKASQMGVRLKCSIQAMVFNKTLRLSSQLASISPDDEISQGQILNHMSVDPMHLFMFFNMGLMAIGIPLQVCIGCLLLYRQLGVTTLISTAIILACVPIQYVLGNKMASLQKKVLEKTDERIKKSNETLQSMKLLKIYSWENIFRKAILRIRSKEVMFLLKAAICRVGSLCVTDGNPIVASVLCFTLYPYIEGKALSPGKIFAAYSIIMIMSVCLFLTPMVINIIAHAIVSTKRLQTFLIAPELQKHKINNNSEQSSDMSLDIEKSINKKNGSYRAVRVNEPDRYSQLKPSVINASSSVENILMLSQVDSDNVVEVIDGEFSWGNRENFTPILHDINFEIKQGGITMIVGSVGCGKSSLLYALLGEMTTHKGMVNWKSNVKLAYGAQKAWLLNTTLRENILFGAKYDEKCYREVIKACALQPDIDMLIAGDVTEIGEKGINLSGGQKQRISLARAMFSNADVVLLDDPFSALDAHVGSHIFENGVKELLLKQRRTVILVTHQLQYLPFADKIMVMDGGKIILEGSYDNLIKTNPEIFKVIEKESDDQNPEIYNIGDMSPTSQRPPKLDLQEKSNEHSSVRTTTKKPMSPPLLNLQRLDKSNVSKSLTNIPKAAKSITSVGELYDRPHHVRSNLLVDDIQCHFGAIRSASSITSLTHREIIGDKLDVKKEYIKSNIFKTDANEKGKIIEEEERETGSVSWKIYYRYAKAATWLLVGVMLTGYVSKILVLRLITDLWLARWSEASTDAEKYLIANNISNVTINEAYNLQYYVSGYVLLSVLGILVLFFQVLSLELMALNASRNLHKKMVNAIVKAPMRFFDVTPIGRILNRMSGDTNTLDEKMSVSVDGFLYCFLYVLGGIIINVIYNPVFIIPAIAMFILYVLVQRFYIASSRELQRLDSISKSPILAHFSETLGGLTTLRAYGHEKRFQQKNFDLVDDNSKALLFLHASNVWMGVRLDCIGSLIILSAAVCMLTSGILGHIEPSIVSIGIAYSLSAGSFINWFMRCLSEVEMWMNASERISYYTDVKPEKDVERSELPKGWPTRGDIQIKNVSLRYDSTLDTVVKNLTLHVKAGEKTGVCGRTGSGKSSLLSSLFNMIDICHGQILIDDIDIKQIRLSDLRSRLAIIPQDPVLFSGTVRYNLDPDCRHSEPEIWRAVEIAQLMPLIGSLQGRLDAKVTEGGDNFSVGQRQLFCLARAFLRSAKILIMDEPTASVDMNTDAIIQEVTQTAFKDITVVTIAHRVATILNYDHIVVMDKGNIIESGSPSELLRKNGAFADYSKKTCNYVHLSFDTKVKFNHL